MARRPGASGGRLVTLTSDVGAAYAAQMKAALIAGGVSPAGIVDLSHDLPAHAVAEAAFLYREMARAFPPSSVHVVVVDPGVGGRRAPIVVATRTGPLLVGPDNGVLHPLARELGIRSAHRIERSALRLARRVGTTFDGRDVFAPAAAALARGVPPSELGPRITPKAYCIPTPVRATAVVRGVVLHIDRFGNLITNIPTEWVSARTRNVGLVVGRMPRTEAPWARSYEELGSGRLGLLGSSFGLVEVAVGNGRASEMLEAAAGARVELRSVGRRTARGEKANSARPRKQR